MSLFFNALLALAVPWCWGSLLVGAFFPAVPPLGRIGIGWGVGLGGVTGLMFALSVLHLPFTSVNVAVALLLGTMALAFLSPRLPLTSGHGEEPTHRDPAPLWLRQAIVVGTGWALFVCTWQNVVWPITDWDALAAYDLRGRAFARFDSIATAAHHGDLTYALSLPPFTSLAHAWVYEVAGGDAPAKLLYSTCFAALIAAFIAFVTRYRSELLAYVVVPGLLLSPLLGQATVAYTNLPSAYAFFIATWATYHAARTGSGRWCMLAGAGWAFAMWTRQSLDPFVAVGLVAICIPWLRRRRIPWYPACAAAPLILPYAWAVYTRLVVYHVNRTAHVLFIAESLVIVFGPPVALSCAAFAFFWMQRQRRRARYLLAGVAVSGLLALGLGFRFRRVVANPSLLRDVPRYLGNNLWPLWGPLLVVFAVCLIVGIRRRDENMWFVALFSANILVFVGSTYLFALTFPEWQSIPDSAVRHSLAMIPVLWACIGIMPGTERMIDAFRALRPARRPATAFQGD